jgi:hypothetical protein
MGFDINIHRIIILYILQVTTLYNAMILGWKVRKIGNNKYELSKKMENQTDFDLKKFVDSISNSTYFVI